MDDVRIKNSRIVKINESLNLYGDKTVTLSARKLVREGDTCYKENSFPLFY